MTSYSNNMLVETGLDHDSRGAIDSKFEGATIEELARLERRRAELEARLKLQRSKPGSKKAEAEVTCHPDRFGFKSRIRGVHQ